MWEGPVIHSNTALWPRHTSIQYPRNRTSLQDKAGFPGPVRMRCRTARRGPAWWCGPDEPTARPPDLGGNASLQFPVYPQLVRVAQEPMNDSNDARNTVDVESMFKPGVPKLTGPAKNLLVINADDCLARPEPVFDGHGVWFRFRDMPLCSSHEFAQRVGPPARHRPCRRKTG